ncbi:hypothetical protein DH2020_030317 [Rehmannia glutinosa]|uniref:Alkyl transferase n=1 Tax=Rehmannia glutinosa TaxID=99300 RepID=A0ABR0VPM7_REHGL
MLSLQFPVPPTINISFSSHHGKKPRTGPNKNIMPNNSAESCNTLINSSLLKFRLAGVPKCATSEIDNQVKTDQIELPEGLVPELMPKHVAVIMDGNRRWAEKRGLPVQLGHRAGGRVIKQLARNCRKHGVQVLTVFTFSTENWDEVDFLMNFFEEIVRSDIEELIPEGNRLSILGNISGLPESLQKLLYSSQERSKANKGLHMVSALNYKVVDIIEAKKIETKVKDGVLQVEDINDTVFEQHLETNGLLAFPNPDLSIRTSGEL